MMEYRGYRAAVKFDDDAGVFHGEVIDTLDVITFQPGLFAPRAERWLN